MDFRCTENVFTSNKAKDDDVQSLTHDEQMKVEEAVENCYSYFKNLVEIEDDIPVLHRYKHKVFLLKGLSTLGQSYECLDASRPWLCYWILHSMELLDIPIPDEVGTAVANFLGKCQSPRGGFAGGPHQQPHLAPTYAAVNALCIIGTEEAYNIIDRHKLLEFLMSVRTKEGAFTMHISGEVDIRGAYCAASAAKLANVVTPELFEGTPEWIVRCQTYEGGFGGMPGVEAHGGYSFCGLAALILMGKERLCDLNALLRWTASRQMAFEGGFQGRTNKLVDGCYSFWQGGAFPLLHIVLSKEGDDALSAEKWMFHQGALQEYLLICCQHPNGGLIDKPGKPRDYYHTCYCLSGMSVAQHFVGGSLYHEDIIGNQDNELKTTHPVFNIGIDGVLNAHQFFGQLEVPQIDQNCSQAKGDS